MSHQLDLITAVVFKDGTIFTMIEEELDNKITCLKEISERSQNFYDTNGC
eukprot:gene192-4438_t